MSNEIKITTENPLGDILIKGCLEYWTVRVKSNDSRVTTGLLVFTAYRDTFALIDKGQKYGYDTFPLWLVESVDIETREIWLK